MWSHGVKMILPLCLWGLQVAYQKKGRLDRNSGMVICGIPIGHTILHNPDPADRLVRSSSPTSLQHMYANPQRTGVTSIIYVQSAYHHVPETFRCKEKRAPASYLEF